MESSTVLAFRIFVMLSCLIIVPMAAIFGSAFPDLVKSVLVDRIVAYSTGKSLDTSPDTTAAGFSELKPAEGGQAPRATNEWEAPRWGSQGAAPAAAWHPQTSGSQAGGIVPAAGLAGVAGGNQPAAFTVAADAGPREYVPLDPPYRSAPGDGVAPLKQPPSHLSTLPAAAAQDAGIPQPLESPDRFTSMERKLREYGATYYLLETWGKEGELYRFHCKMAVGNNPSSTRHFEATDRDALAAMSQVLERVEAWRAGRLQ